MSIKYEISKKELEVVGYALMREFMRLEEDLSLSMNLVNAILLKEFKKKIDQTFEKMFFNRSNKAKISIKLQWAASFLHCVDIMNYSESEQHLLLPIMQFFQQETAFPTRSERLKMELHEAQKEEWEQQQKEKYPNYNNQNPISYAG